MLPPIPSHSKHAQAESCQRSSRHAQARQLQPAHITLCCARGLRSQEVSAERAHAAINAPCFFSIIDNRSIDLPSIGHGRAHATPIAAPDHVLHLQPRRDQSPLISDEGVLSRLRQSQAKLRRTAKTPPPNTRSRSRELER